MRSDAIDQLLGRALELPVQVSWEGEAADALRGSLRSPTIALGSVPSPWLPLDAVEFSARRIRFVPGLPAKLEVEAPSLRVAVAQAEVDGWIARVRFPFGLRLTAKGLVVCTRLTGIPVAELETRLSVLRGWFVLEPKRAGLLGLPSWARPLLRSYLPLPPLAEGSRLTSLQHEHGRIWLGFESDDFVDELTPGLADRLRRRVVPTG